MAQVRSCAFSRFRPQVREQPVHLDIASPTGSRRSSGSNARRRGRPRNPDIRSCATSRATSSASSSAEPSADFCPNDWSWRLLAARPASFAAMKELIRTNDAVIISFVEALMRDAGIAHFVADQNMSVLDGSLGILPRRIMVDADEIDRARTHPCRRRHRQRDQERLSAETRCRPAANQPRRSTPSTAAISGWCSQRAPAIAPAWMR